LGDPFQKLIERREQREWLVRVGLKVTAVAAMVVLVWLALWCLNDGGLEVISNLSRDCEIERRPV